MLVLSASSVDRIPSQATALKMSNSSVSITINHQEQSLSSSENLSSHDYEQMTNEQDTTDNQASDHSSNSSWSDDDYDDFSFASPNHHDDFGNELDDDCFDSSDTDSDDDDDEAFNFSSLKPEAQTTTHSDYHSDSSDSTSNEDVNQFPSFVALPFWWGNEDQDQLQFIINSYDRLLQLDSERELMIRQPKPFIGKIYRRQVSSNGTFQSVDKVSVFRREALPFGRTMPLTRTHWVISTWNQEAGIPFAQVMISEDVAKRVWLSRVLATSQSTIFCEPFFLEPVQTAGRPSRSNKSVSCPPFYSLFECSVSSKPSEKDHSNIGYAGASKTWAKFFPEASFSDPASLNDC